MQLEGYDKAITPIGCLFVNGPVLHFIEDRRNYGMSGITGMTNDERQGGMSMGSRGVTRPMAEHALNQHHQKNHGDDGHGEPYSEARYQMLHMHHRQTLWIYWGLILLGFWMVFAPFNFGYLNEALWVNPSGGRGVWGSSEMHIALRAWLMTWSDVASGVLLIFLGWRSLRPDRPISLWLAAGIGAWLSAAPVLFWAPVAGAYVNNTLVGMLVIALAILIPGMPNMILYMKMGGATPPGWSYNPSSWPQRWIMIVLAFAGLLASRYLAMFQMGYIGEIRDPFFGESTQHVLNSNMSHALPISDASLGALAYTFEFLMGFMGGPARWRTMPWMVTFFGILVIPLGLVHIVLVISQPVVVGEWCTFCLLAAAIMLPMIPLEVDEVVAMAQHVRQAKKRGEGLWSVFWKGGNPGDSRVDERTPELMKLPENPAAVVKSSVWGMSVPWTLAISTAIGIAMMTVPDTLGIEKPVSTIFHLCGSLVVVVSVITLGEPLRLGRYVNVLLGVILALGPWFVDGVGLAAQLAGLFAGVTVIALALPCGPVHEDFGTWDKLVR